MAEKNESAGASHQDFTGMIVWQLT